MGKKENFNSTIYTCYLSSIVMAVVCNFPPLLFLFLRETYGFSFGAMGALVSVNFVTQVATDVLFSKVVDKYGYRPFIILGECMCALGFLVFASTPWVFAGMEYTGLVIGTILFSIGAGLQELLLSPIMDALPTENKEKAMSLMHSFYAWGQVLAVALSTILLMVLGSEKWPFIMLGWMALPITSATLFCFVPLRQRVSAEKAMKIRELLSMPLFLFALVAISCGGASEVTICQWTSSFMEGALDMPKVWGDILGMSGFAVMMGLGRMLYGLYGERFDLHKLLVAGSVGATALYVIAALTNSGGIAVIACCLIGFCVSLLWPGTLSVAAGMLPMAGASMFALAAAGGDLGCAVGPWFAGIVTDWAAANVQIAGFTAQQVGLRAGILSGTIFPAVSLVFQLLLWRACRKKRMEQAASGRKA
ncbi:MAG: MFS transporter [Ruminococcaceae bacterium]|nr:MFS transporter [Oscillospiraceae bacterium]